MKAKKYVYRPLPKKWCKYPPEVREEWARKYHEKRLKAKKAKLEAAKQPQKQVG